MKVLISHSYFLKFDPKQWAQQKPYPPLATLFAVACLRENGHEIKFIDANFLDNEQPIFEALESFKPDVFVLYEDGFNYLTKMCLTNMRQAAFNMIERAKTLGIQVILSGSDSTDHYQEYLQKGADYVIKGEAEETLLALLQDQAVAEIAGLWYQENTEIKFTHPRKVKKDLDALPFPAWDVLDIEPYQKAWQQHGYFSINMATTRGCPYKCNWCAKPIYGNRYNSHSPKYVVHLLAYMKTLFHFDHIWFSDDIFGLKPGWVQEFSQELLKAKIEIKYKIQSRADLLVQENTVEALAQSGCDEVWIGAESGSQKVLDAMDKGTTIAQIKKSVLLMKHHGIKPCFFLQFGYPGEDWQDINLTLKMLDQLKPYDIGVSVSYPLPGTKFYENVKEELVQKSNWTDSDELLLMYKGTYSPEFYKRLHRYVHRKFRALSALDAIKSNSATAFKKLTYFYHKPLAILAFANMKRALKS